MCGRFEIHSAIEIILRIFQAESGGFDIRPSYNIAPGDIIPIVVHEGGGNRLVSCKWGFVPEWSKEDKTGYRMINARAESLRGNASFRDAFASRRCIVPADGFFEWKKADKARMPYLVRLKSGRPMGLAGLYSVRRSPDNESLCTCTIITTDANAAVAPVHDRMPVILSEDGFATWLDPKADVSGLERLLQPFSAEEIELFPVTPKMNSYKYNDAENIKPLSA